MKLLKEYKNKSKLYKISFPNGYTYTFKTLSWGDFITYHNLLSKQTIPNDVLEDKIFRQCSLDPYISDEAFELKAGIISTIVKVILYLSGPTDSQSFNQSIQASRQFVNSLNSQIQMIICRAFPAYKPEDLEVMNWDNLVFRLAQAEHILMTKQPPEISEPIKLVDTTTGPISSSNRVNAEELVKEGRRIASHPDFGNSEEVRNKQSARGIQNPRQQAQQQKLREIQRRVNDVRR